MDYETHVEISVAGFDLPVTFHHDGHFVSAVEFPDGTTVHWRDVAAGRSAVTGEKVQMFHAINLAITRRYGDRLQHLEYEMHDAAATHADRENRRQREAA